MTLMTLFRCKMVLLHTSQMFDKYCSSAFVIESSCLILQFRGYLASPDLSPMDFIFWGYLKSNIYTSPQGTHKSSEFVKTERFEKTLIPLKIPLAMIPSSLLSTVFLMQCVIVNEFQHVENLLFE